MFVILYSVCPAPYYWITHYRPECGIHYETISRHIHINCALHPVFIPCSLQSMYHLKLVRCFLRSIASKQFSLLNDIHQNLLYPFLLPVVTRCFFFYLNRPGGSLPQGTDSVSLNLLTDLVQHVNLSLLEVASLCRKKGQINTSGQKNFSILSLQLIQLQTGA